MKIPVRSFNGLYTNIDATDKAKEYFPVYKNIRTYPGFIEAKKLLLSKASNDIPVGHIFVYQDVVFLDNDKYSNYLDGIELKNNYIQNIKKYDFRITYNEGKYYFWTRLFGTTNWLSVYGDQSPLPDIAGQYPITINEDGILKILFKSRAIWIGRVTRYYFLFNGQQGQVTASEDRFFAFPLVENFSTDNIGALFNAEIETQYSLPTTVEVRGTVKFPTFYFYHSGVSQEFNFVGIELKDLNGNTVLFSNDSGMLLLGKVVNAVQNKFYIVFWKGHTDINPHPAGNPNPNIQMYWKVKPGTGFNGTDIWHGTGNFNDPSQWVFFETNSNFDMPDLALSWIQSPLFVNLTQANLENKFKAGDDIEILTTVIIDNNEYPINLQKLSDSISDFVVKIVPNSLNILNNYKKKTSCNIYIRYTTSLIEVTNKDFELAYSIPFTFSKPTYFPLYLNSLSPNGIFLTQMIGKFFNPTTYKIITNPDDYTTVGGVSYVIKNSNVYYPAVGGGNILNNVFYYENFIPGVEGQFITSMGSNLGIFAKNKEEFTMVDFQPVESSMIFYIKDTASYKIRDYYDMIETNEGTILNLREGIVLTNGYNRTTISEQINDIIEKNYDTSTIFFNSYLKHLYYHSNAGLYMYDFRTQVWNQFELPQESNFKNVKRLYGDIAPTADMAIVDYIEDYEGNFYFVTASSVWKVELVDSGLTDKPGYLRISLIDASEMNINKVINWLSFDCEKAVIEATFKAKGKAYRIGNQAKSTNVRTISYLQNILKYRIPISQLSIDIKFQGRINNIELDIDVIPKVKR
jgi:hypothetical protein